MIDRVDQGLIGADRRVHRRGNFRVAESQGMLFFCFSVCIDKPKLVDIFMVIGKTIMRLVIMAGVMAINQPGNCQKAKAKIVRGMCPFEFGVIEVIERTTGMDSRVGASIRGMDSIVVAVKDGEVEGIFEVADLKVVMILSGKLFYTEADLDSAFVCKGQQVKAGMPIGVSRKKRIDFVVSDRKGQGFWPDKYLDCRVEIIKSK